MKVGYVRVSTIEQHEERQVISLKEVGCEKVFIDKCSGKDMNRPQFQQMMDFVRDGDILYVSEFSRLARSTKDLLNIIDKLAEKNVQVISQKENFDTSTPQGRLMLTFMQGIAQFERDLIKERQAEGIAIAKEQGKFAKPVTPKPAGWKELYSQYKQREITATALAKKLGISRSLLYKWIREEKE